MEPCNRDHITSVDSLVPTSQLLSLSECMQDPVRHGTAKEEIDDG